MKISGVYLITCNQNGRNYIGSSKDIYKRWSQHKALLHNRNHHSIKLQEDWDKFGEENFSFQVLQETDYANAKKIEEEYIGKFKSDIFGYNSENHKHELLRKDDLTCSKILEYIHDTYSNDGNIYCYDPFKMAKYLKITATNLLKFLGVNSKKKFNTHRELKGDIMIGLNWSNDVFIEILDETKFNNCSEYVFVDL